MENVARKRDASVKRLKALNAHCWVVCVHICAVFCLNGGVKSESLCEGVPCLSGGVKSETACEGVPYLSGGWKRELASWLDLPPAICKINSIRQIGQVYSRLSKIERKIGGFASYFFVFLCSLVTVRSLPREVRSKSHDQEDCPYCLKLRCRRFLFVD